MQALTEKEMESLCHEQSGTCLSIYLPMVKAGKEVQQNSIRFKNSLKEAETKLLNNGLSDQEVEELLEPARRLLDDQIFWQHQEEGLAVFLTPKDGRQYRLPVKFESSVTVDTKFNIKPLVPYRQKDRSMYLLALSQNENKLFKCTQDMITEVKVDDLPASLADALKYDDGEKQLQYHTGDNGGQIYHGQGAEEKVEQENLKRYFRQIDQALKGALDRKSPLAVVCVDYLFYIYQECNSYPHLLERHIEGSPEHLSEDELHSEVRKVMNSLYEQEKQASIDKYANHLSSDQTVADCESIVPAAYYGQVESLFIPADYEKWGLFDPEKSEIYFHDENKAKDSELVNLAATYTIKNGGEVHILPEDDERFQADQMVALLRYEY